MQTSPIPLQVRQKAVFALSSATITAEEMTTALGMEPDRVSKRGSKSASPARPAFHSWAVEAPAGNVDAFTEQVDALVARLEPISDRLATLAQRVIQDPSGAPYPQWPTIRRLSRVPWNFGSGPS